MMRCKQMFSFFALVAPVAVAVAVASPLAGSEAVASTLYPNLCEVTRACIITPKVEAIAFEGDVCWNGAATTVMGQSGCSGSAKSYSLNHGYVEDPITNTVYPMLPVADACSEGYCVTDLSPIPWLDEGAACCNPDTKVCKSLDDSDCEFGSILWCKNLEDNGNGTVTCHEPS